MIRVDSNNRVAEAAPIVRKFIGQDVQNLFNWMKKLGDFKCTIM